MATPGDEIAVTEKGTDIYKSAVAVAGDGTAWIFWSQNKSYQAVSRQRRIANFDIWARPLKDGKLGEAVKISDSKRTTSGRSPRPIPPARSGLPGRAPRPRVQDSDRRQEGNGWSKEQTVSTQSHNCWAPAIAATSTGGGKVAIAWDTYDKGDYDIWIREFDNSGKAGEARPGGQYDDYEARPALYYDHEGSLWVAWEESGPSWGKDWSGQAPFDNRDGIGLYRDRQIGLAV